MKNTSSTTIFKLSIVSSLLLVVGLMYGQKLWSELWLISAFIELAIFVFFGIVFISTIIFGFKQKSNYNNPFLPFWINFIFLVLVVLLPLNAIRNRIEFSVLYNSYNKAADFIYKANINSKNSLYNLPEEYKSLSAGGGEVIVINKDSAQAIFFYTFRGTPDGRSGFVRVNKGQQIDHFIPELLNEVFETKDLGNDWYYIAGE